MLRASGLGCMALVLPSGSLKRPPKTHGTTLRVQQGTTPREEQLLSPYITILAVIALLTL